MLTTGTSAHIRHVSCTVHQPDKKTYSQPRHGVIEHATILMNKTHAWLRYMYVTRSVSCSHITQRHTHSMHHNTFFFNRNTTIEYSQCYMLASAECPGKTPNRALSANLQRQTYQPRSDVFGVCYGTQNHRYTPQWFTSH